MFSFKIRYPKENLIKTTSMWQSDGVCILPDSPASVAVCTSHSGRQDVWPESHRSPGWLGFGATENYTQRIHDVPEYIQLYIQNLLILNSSTEYKKLLNLTKHTTGKLF